MNIKQKMGIWGIGLLTGTLSVLADTENRGFFSYLDQQQQVVQQQAAAANTQMWLTIIAVASIGYVIWKRLNR